MGVTGVIWAFHKGQRWSTSDNRGHAKLPQNIGLQTKIRGAGDSGAGDGNRTRVLSLRLRLVAKTPASTAKEEIPGILRHQPDIANCDMCEVGTPRGQPV